MRAILIGCGGIGALYDLETDHILTHAKALSLSKIDFDVYDTDKTLADKIGKKYNATVLDKVTQSTFQNYTVACICTPTEHHFHYLKLALRSGIKHILCEKPLSLNLDELTVIENDYTISSSIVSVNYIRRFTPGFKRLKSIIEQEKLGNPKFVTIHYNRGFMNYGSHAWDTIAYLMNKEILPGDCRISSAMEFKENDPILDVEFQSNGTRFRFQGVPSDEAVFNIEMNYETADLYLTDYGNAIKLLKHPSDGKTNSVLQNECLYSEGKALKDYMKYALADQLGIKDRNESNFLESLALNRSMLNIIKSH